MPDHDADGRLRDHIGERQQVSRPELLDRWGRDADLMRVAARVAVAGEVLHHGEDAGVEQTLRERQTVGRGDRRVGRPSAVADAVPIAVGQIQDRCEVDVEAQCPHGEPVRFCKRAYLLRRHRCRHHGRAGHHADGLLEVLHPAAFFVDRDEGWNFATCACYRQECCLA